ncbi:hypothetical protein H5410_045270 [Solanum commersonii]|uniref:Uncharacterized protein n=1 Tax=Solanum commersonii TaxID=4109 RepID=A0A9J5XC93_SOLCO|nr:hypothetical protein H5410_045270 [Solanum commersonii]
MGESLHCVFLCEWHLNTLVELELAFEASIVILRIFDNGELPNGLNLAQSSSVPSPKEKIKSVRKGSSWRITEQLREAVLCRPMNQNAKMLKEKAERR